MCLGDMEKSEMILFFSNFIIFGVGIISIIFHNLHHSKDIQYTQYYTCKVWR